MNRRAGRREHEQAEKILQRELETEPIPPDLAVAIDRIVDRLCRRFRELIGTDGYVAVVARAAYLSRSEAPFLENVDVSGSGSGAQLHGLRLGIADQDEASIRPGFVTFIANIIWLLVTFLGERLGSRIIQETWPEKPSEVYGHGPEGGPS